MPYRYLLTKLFLKTSIFGCIELLKWQGKSPQKELFDLFFDQRGVLVWINIEESFAVGPVKMDNFKLYSQLRPKRSINMADTNATPFLAFLKQIPQKVLYV